ncbi:MAG: leucine--tRNA ligase [Chitinophagales bacterium]|nr:leucine--tRNA ligase [Chitinophagales bacterium]
MHYDFRSIEEKWKSSWEKQDTYKVHNNSEKEKFYVLSMFPYPSGKGLHVGHPLGYVVSDIIARHKRMQGFNVLNPMGFDAFGLPAEQYAIESGRHPADTTKENIQRYKSQLKNIGFCYDWSREISTCDPSYYKWTQWLFLKIYNSYYDSELCKAESITKLIEKFEQEGNINVRAATDHEGSFTTEEWNGFDDAEKEAVLQKYRLAYLSHGTVNWCPGLGTILANDEVKDGLSERGGFPVEKIQMKQWFLRITAYADRLLDGLETVDYPESLKEMQKNWIGKSYGESIFFRVAESDKKIEIFTTRADTIFGATFMVLAPEHELIAEITTAEQKKEIEEYVSYVGSRSDIERQAEKRVTGAFTGSYAVNPLTEQKIPIWIAEYVLIGYGTGAIMAVPADDERDYAFAEKFDLEVVEIIDRSDHPEAKREDKVGKLKNSSFLNGLSIDEAIEKVGEKLEEMGIGKKQVNYKIRDAGYSRQRYWGEPFPIVYRDGVPYPLDEKELPLELPDVEKLSHSDKPESPLAEIDDWVNLPDGSVRETDTMPGFAGSSWYFLRFMDPNNDRRFVGEDAEHYWQNVDFYIGGAEHSVGHLMYSRFWQKVFFDLGLVSQNEPYKKLVNNGMIQGRSNIVYRRKNTNNFVSKGLIDDFEDYTPIHVDIALVENDKLDVDGFKQWRSEYEDAKFELEEGAYHCGVEVEKMSKRWHNVVNPDDVIDKYGADCLRLYEMFLGPIEQSKPWDTKGIDGVSKFLRKLWRLFYEDDKFIVDDSKPTEDNLKTLHLMLKKVSDYLDKLSFNTCVSAFMICVNELTDQKCRSGEVLIPLVKAIAPFAPFIAEELYSKSGFESSIFDADFPQYDEKFLKEDNYEYPVSINGKVRAKINLALDLKQAEVEKEVLAIEDLDKWVDGKSIKKIIYVPGKIINLVIA